jgi:nicotinate-nucleotide adenylyltransferase
MEQSSRGQRIAFFGGSFDPPHLGHLAVARAAQSALQLDSVLFAPVGAQPLKPQGSTAAFEDRAQMTRLAIAGIAGFSLSLADAPRPSSAPNYTYETLQELRASLPPATTLFCLMGADSFFSLRRWHRSAEIPFVAPMIVASRPGQDLLGLRAALPAGLTMEAAPVIASEPLSGDPSLPHSELRSCLLRNTAGETAPFYLLPGLHVEISASQVRDWIRAQDHPQADTPAPGNALLRPAVLDYIRSHGLYL